MSDVQVGTLRFADIRALFPHEATSFTTWLEQNLDTLSDRLGIELEVEEREKTVGEFKVDLLCKDKLGNNVIVENQLERTDHDHLGKVLTYLVNLEAKTAVWLTTDPRPEHVRVVDWLNEVTGADMSFYLVRVEAIRIDESRTAPLFTVLVKPDEQTKIIRRTRKDGDALRLEFWKQLLERSRPKTTLFTNITPQTGNWIETGAGKSGVSFVYYIRINDAQIELYIYHDSSESGAKNKLIFDGLFSEKAQIEEEIGFALDWERLDDRRASRIKKLFTTGGFSNQESWPSLQEEMIDAMIRFEKAMQPRLAKINV